MQTPIVVGNHLYLCNDRGILSAYKALSGDPVFRRRLPVRSGFTASPVAADGKIYLTAESGDVVVVKASDSFQHIATNPLGETTLATPAISMGTLLFRTQHQLVAVEQAESKRTMATGNQKAGPRSHLRTVSTPEVGKASAGRK